MRLHSEEHVCPRSKRLYTAERVLRDGQSERGGHRCWDTEQRERDPTSRLHACIASEPKRPVVAVMGALGPGPACRDRICTGREPLLLLDVYALMTKQVPADPTVMPTTPVRPEERPISNHEWMQEDAHLARLFGGAALPLTLFTQRAGTATMDAGCIHHTQAAIGFSAAFVREQFLASRTTECAIWLKRKVDSGEVPRFPGGGSGRWAVS